MTFILKKIMNKPKNNKNNIVKFPSNLDKGEREVEAILFAAAEPLNIDTIESKISKKINVIGVVPSLLTTWNPKEFPNIKLVIAWGEAISHARGGRINMRVVDASGRDTDFQLDREIQIQDYSFPAAATLPNGDFLVLH